MQYPKVARSDMLDRIAFNSVHVAQEMDTICRRALLSSTVVSDNSNNNNSNSNVMRRDDNDNVASQGSPHGDNEDRKPTNRRISNRLSAKRSRMQKKRILLELNEKVLELTNTKDELMSKINEVVRLSALLKEDNNRLRPYASSYRHNFTQQTV